MAVQLLIDCTGVPQDTASRLLEMAAGNVERAAELYFSDTAQFEAPHSFKSRPAAGEQPVLTPHGNWTNDSNHHRDPDEEGVLRAPIEPRRDQMLPRARSGFGVLPPSFVAPARASVFDPFRDFQTEALLVNGRAVGASNPQPTATANLANLFRPPLELIFNGNFEEAKQQGCVEGKWILVNIQKTDEFACQILNRDVWRASRVQECLQDNFLLWQRQHDSRDGAWYQQFYRLDAFPHVAVIDPTTGRRMITFGPCSTEANFLDRAWDFLAANALGGSAVSASSSTTSPLKAPARADSGALPSAKRRCLAASPICIDVDGSGDGVVVVENSGTVPSAPVPANERTKGPTQAAPSMEPPSDAQGSLVSILRFVLPDGARLQRRFWTSETVKDLHVFLESHGFPATEFSCLHPADRYRMLDTSATLSSLGGHNSLTAQLAAPEKVLSFPTGQQRAMLPLFRGPADDKYAVKRQPSGTSLFGAVLPSPRSSPRIWRQRCALAILVTAVFCTGVLLGHHQVVPITRLPEVTVAKGLDQRIPPFEPGDDALDAIRRGSRVWCHGADVNHRQCHFHNLCFSPLNDEFVFFHGPDSVFEGVPEKRFEPAVASMSSLLDHNVVHFSFVDLPVSALESLDTDVFLVPATSYLFKRFKPNNIMHALHDDIIPLHYTLQSLVTALDESDIQLVSVETWPEGDFFHLFRLFSKKEPLLKNHLPSHGFVCFQSAHVGMSKAPAWYDYGFSKPQGPIEKLHAGPFVRQAASFMRSKLGIVPQTPRVGEIVLFSRARNRFIDNEASLIEALSARFRRKVVVLQMETHSFREQVAVLAGADLALGMHGSMLCMAMFLPPGAALLELYPYAVPAEHYTPYKTMAALPGMNISYASWTNGKEDHSRAHPDHSAHLGGLAHLPPAERELVRSAKTVPPHVCCSSPYWLYRIYQDTLVDVDAVLAIAEALLAGAHQPPNPPPLPMLPARILDPRCGSRTVGNQAALQVEWSAAWNARFLHDVQYEVWIQELYKAWRTKDTRIEIADAALRPGAALTVWVRAVVVAADRVDAPVAAGPFSPLLRCQLL